MLDRLSAIRGKDPGCFSSYVYNEKHYPFHIRSKIRNKCGSHNVRKPFLMQGVRDHTEGGAGREGHRELALLRIPSGYASDFYHANS